MKPENADSHQMFGNPTLPPHQTEPQRMTFGGIKRKIDSLYCGIMPKKKKNPAGNNQLNPGNIKIHTRHHITLLRLPVDCRKVGESGNQKAREKIPLLRGEGEGVGQRLFRSQHLFPLQVLLHCHFVLVSRARIQQHFLLDTSHHQTPLAL